MGDPALQAVAVRVGVHAIATGDGRQYEGGGPHERAEVDGALLAVPGGAVEVLEGQLMALGETVGEVEAWPVLGVVDEPGLAGVSDGVAGPVCAGGIVEYGLRIVATGPQGTALAGEQIDVGGDAGLQVADEAGEVPAGRLAEQVDVIGHDDEGVDRDAVALLRPSQCRTGAASDDASSDFEGELGPAGATTCIGALHESLESAVGMAAQAVAEALAVAVGRLDAAREYRMQPEALFDDAAGDEERVLVALHPQRAGASLPEMRGLGHARSSDGGGRQLSARDR